MTTDRAPKEAKDQKNRRQETQALGEAFQIEAAAPLRPDHAHILLLQRTIGNQAVQRLLAESNSLVQREESAPVADTPVEPARPVITPDVLAAMDAQIDWIIGKLKEWRFDADEQMQVLSIIRQYSHMDFEAYESTGYSGSDYLDKFLVKLKMRSFHDDTYSTFGIEKNQLVYDALWTEFDDERRAILASYIADSRKEKTNGPLVEQQPGFWQTLGKQEAMGLWGMLKGMGMGLGGMIDAGTGVVKGINNRFSDKPMEDPINVSKFLEEQFDESGKMMFGKEFKEGEGLIGGLNAGDIGTAGGSLIWQLTMIGAGDANVVGETAAWAQNAKTGIDIAGNLGGIFDAGDKIADVIARHQRNDDMSVESLLADPELFSAISALAANIAQALMGAKGVGGKAVAPALKESFKRLSLILSSAQVGQTVDKLIDIIMSDKLEPQAKERAITQTVIELIKQGASIVGEKYGDKKIGGDDGAPGSQGTQHETGKPVPDEDKNTTTSQPGGGGSKQQSEESPFGAPNSFIGEPEAHPTSSQTGDTKPNSSAKEDLFGAPNSFIGEPDTNTASSQTSDSASKQKAKEDLFDLSKPNLSDDPDAKAPTGEKPAEVETTKSQADRAQTLGNDPKRGYIPHEGEVGAMIEKNYGGFKRDPSGDGEWISVSGPYQGKTFDLLGVPEGKSRFHSDAMEKFLPSVDAHFRKQIDFVVLDTRYMTPAQKASVMKHIDNNHSSQKNRLIILE